MGNKRGRGGNETNQEFKHRYVVRSDATVDGEPNYDTLSLIAEEWLRLNPDATSIEAGDLAKRMNLAGLSRAKKRKVIEEWIDTENKLVDINGKMCKEKGGAKFRAPLIWPGLNLDLPMVEGTTTLVDEGAAAADGKTVKVVDPQQAGPCGKKPRGAKSSCEPTEVAASTVEAAPTDNVGASQTMPVKVEAPKERGRYEFFHHASQSTDGKTYRVGSMDHAMMALARSGLDPRFTEEYYAIKNIVARKSIRKDRDTGQMGEESFGDDGKGFGENRESSKNNKHAKRDANTGGKGFVGESLTGGKTRVYFPGDAHVLTEGVDAGAYERHDGLRSNFAYGGNLGKEGFLRKFVMPLGEPKVPYGYSIGNPSHQEKFHSMTARWGLSHVVTELADVNFGGYDNLFRDQHARDTDPLETPDRVYAYMHALNSQKNLVEGLAAVDNAKTLQEKQVAAERAMIAYRDFGNNILIKRVDSMQIPLEKSAAGMRAYLTSQGVDVAAIDEKIKTAPMLDVVDMPQEQLETLQGYNRQENKRYRDIKPGQTNIAFKASEPFAVRNKNYFENEVSEERGVERSEVDVSKQSWGAIQTIMSNGIASETFRDFIAENPDARVEISNLLHDIHRNPRLYGFKNTKEAEEQLLDKIVPRDNEEARKEMTKKGRTSPLLVTGDERFHNQNPKILAALVANSDDAVLRDLLNRAVNPEYGVDSKGRTDGRPFGRALLHAYGAEMDASAENAFGTHYNVLANALGKDSAEEIQVREAVRDASVYVERGASGRSVKGVQYLDNRFQDEQIKADQTGKIDLNKTYGTLFTSQEARDADADKIAVLGLSAHAPLARDAILATILRDPKSLSALQRAVADAENETGSNTHDNLRDVKRSSIKNEYGDLKRTLKRTQRAAEKYQRTGDADDLEKAARKFGMFFTEMEAKATKNGGALHNNAWNVMIHAIGGDEKMSAAVVETISNDAALRDAFIKAVPDAIMSTDGVRVTNKGKRGTGRQFADTSTDALYTSRFFDLPTNSKGKVKVGGLFGIGRNQVDVNIDALTAAIGHVNPLGEGVTSNRSAHDMAMEAYVNGTGAGAATANQDLLAALSATRAGLADAAKQGANLTEETRASLRTSLNASLDALNAGAGQNLSADTKSSLTRHLTTSAAILGNTQQVIDPATINNLTAASNQATAELKAKGVGANLSNDVSVNNGVKGPVKMAQTTAQLNPGAGLSPEVIEQLQVAGIKDLGATKNNVLGTNMVAYVGNLLLDPKLSADAKQQAINNLAVPVVTKLLSDAHVVPPAGTTLEQAAQQLIASGLVKASGDAKQLTLSTSDQLPTGQTLEGALHVGSNLGAVGGFDTRWLLAGLAFIPHTKTVYWYDYVTICPDCGPVGGLMKSAGGNLPEGVFEVTNVAKSVTGELAPQIGKASVEAITLKR